MKNLLALLFCLFPLLAHAQTLVPDQRPLARTRDSAGWTPGIYISLGGGTIVPCAAPSEVLLNQTTGTTTTFLPPASSCPGKVFFFSQNASGATNTVARSGTDTIDGGATLPFGNNNIYAQRAVVQSDGISTWHIVVPLLQGTFQGGTGTILNGANGSVVYQASNGLGGTLNTTAVGTSGQLMQSVGAGAPTWTSAPGSVTAFTSVTSAGYISKGTKFTTSGCSISSTTGGGTAGTFTLGANTCTVIITMNGATGLTAPTGWTCSAHDLTSPADLIGGESSSNTTTASITIPVTTGATDVISFSCTGY